MLCWISSSILRVNQRLLCNRAGGNGCANRDDMFHCQDYPAAFSGLTQMMGSDSFIGITDNGPNQVCSASRGACISRKILSKGACDCGYEHRFPQRPGTGDNDAGGHGNRVHKVGKKGKRLCVSRYVFCLMKKAAGTPAHTLFVAHKTCIQTKKNKRGVQLWRALQALSELPGGPTQVMV